MGAGTDRNAIPAGAVDRSRPAGKRGSAAVASAIRQAAEIVAAPRSGMAAERTPDAVGREFGLLEHSLYNYGVPDLTAINRVSAQDRARLGRIIEQTLAAFEPRLKKVKVTQIEAASATQHVLRFQIEGLLDMDPAPELISFDTVLQLSSGEYQVKGDSGAGCPAALLRAGADLPPRHGRGGRSAPARNRAAGHPA